MAMKITKDTNAVATQTESTEMVALPISGALVAATPIRDTDDLFPQIKIIWPVEVGPDRNFKSLADCYQPGIYDGKSFTKLPAGWIATVIASRDMLRKQVLNEKGEVTYERAYKSFEGLDGESKADFETWKNDNSVDAKGKPVIQKGTAFILGILLPTGDAAVVELQACKSMQKFWGIPLSQAVLTNRLGLKVLIADLSVCLEASPVGQYLSNKKFKQHEIVELSEAQIKALQPVYAEVASKLNAWLKK